MLRGGVLARENVEVSYQNTGRETECDLEGQEEQDKKQGGRIDRKGDLTALHRRVLVAPSVSHTLGTNLQRAAGFLGAL